MLVHCKVTYEIAYIHKIVEEGRKIFWGKEAHSFGTLSAEEWNNMFYKYLSHHLTQLGV